MPCDGDVTGVFPEPPEGLRPGTLLPPPPPPPDPPFPPLFGYSPPYPPPAEVIVLKLPPEIDEFEPEFLVF